MIRQTGGSAVGDTSTRSRPALAASARASVREMTPNCCPSISITLTDAALISRLIFKSFAMGHLQKSNKLPILCTLFTDKGNERLHIDGPEVLPVPLPRRNLAGGHFPIADHEHERRLLHLRLPDLVAQFFVPEISLHPDPRIEETLPNLLTPGD